VRQRAVVVAVAVVVALLCLALTSAAAALALWQPDVERLNANTTSQLHADYSPDPRGVRFAPLRPGIVGAAQDDSVQLDTPAAAQATSPHVDIVRLPTANAAAVATPFETARASETPGRSTPTPVTGTPAVGTATPARTPTSAPPTETATDVPPQPADTPEPQPTPSPTPTKPTVSEPTFTPTPTPRPALRNTGLQNCSGNAADTGGAGDGYEVTPKYACAEDGLFAHDVSSSLLALPSSCGSANADRHRFFNYGFSIPGGSTIAGITVRLDAAAQAQALGLNPVICVELSWDGGSSWTKAKSTPALGSSEGKYLLGGETDTWGRTWGHSEFDDGHLVVRLTDTSLAGIRSFDLDWVAVNVTYTP
jgi:hypothetical protein